MTITEIIGSTIYGGHLYIAAVVSDVFEKEIIVLCKQNDNYRIVDQKETKKEVFRQIYQSLV